MSKTSDLDQTIREKVFSNLSSAKEGGQFEIDGYLKDMSADDIAYDLICYAEDLEMVQWETLIPYIKEWLSL